jgi:hypothetical protein
MVHVEPLVEEAAKKAAVAWLAVPGAGPAYLVWCAWLGGSLLVVSGPGEQSAPGLAEAATAEGGAAGAGAAGAGAAGAGAAGAGAAAAGTAISGTAAPGTVEVSLRGDHGGRIVTWTAAVERLDPAGEAWAELVPQLAGKRLNGGTDLATRWATECVVTRLTPVEDAPLVPMPEDSQAAPPKPSPATRLPKRPFRLHKVRGARR